MKFRCHTPWHDAFHAPAQPGEALPLGIARLA